ncbi:topoisomerase 6 subunit A [Perkinsela sp. CCAP 1560/4]|nr:topoisomerase 6 subunit A [Perkinsela sp. CCAP 1560/4]|eukprot:KNH05661.1 topoisomerase 6 subunit A [Perkinsela sp. CCAP 1560/4]
MKLSKAERLFYSSFLVAYSRILCASVEGMLTSRAEEKTSNVWNERCSKYFRQNPTDPSLLFQENLSIYKNKQPKQKVYPTWRELQYLQKEPFLLRAKQNESRRKVFFAHMEGLKRTAFESFQKHVEQLRLFDFQPNPSMFRAIAINDQGFYAQQALREIQTAIKYFHRIDKVNEKYKRLKAH